jgi:hypothetical protein
MGAVPVNVLANPRFEAGTGALPDGWAESGPGRATWIREGVPCVKLTGEGTEAKSFKSLYTQAGRARPGTYYEATVRFKLAGGSGWGGVAFTFTVAGGETKLFWYGLNGLPDWHAHAFGVIAPEGAESLVLAVNAGNGSSLLFSEVTLVEKPAGRTEDKIEFDLGKLGQVVDGFGVMYWPPELVKPAAEFGALNIRYIRITKDGASWEHLQWLYGECRKLGVKWLYTLWSVPKEFQGPDGNLVDPAGFADHWVGTVRELDEHGCRPHFIDLENEPDYFGIPAEPYAELIRQVRVKLDAAGFRDVVLTGPGLTHVGAGNFLKYRDALDRKAVDAIGVWTGHAWDDAWNWEKETGEVVITDLRAEPFVQGCRERDPNKPIWITEYATRQRTFHGITYPHSDTESAGNYSASFTMPYAIRTYANTLSMLNHGVNSVFYWSSGDVKDSPKQWGYLGPDGEKKPVYHALRSLWGAIRPGSRAVLPPPEMGLKAVYAGAYLDYADPKKPVLVVGVANTSAEKRKAVIRLGNAPKGLAVAAAERVEIEAWGDVATKRPDVARAAPASVKLEADKDGYSFVVEMARDSALTVRLAP